MPDFLILFPPEIVTNIISYISQSDCIECLRVCHRWHDVISTHSQQVWRHLTLVEEALVIDGCMTKCLPHVQEVTFKGFRPYVILKRLADLTCNITFLGKYSDVSHVIKLNRFVEFGESLEYSDIDGTENLIDTVSPVQNTLTELIVNEFPLDISLVDVLRSLPKLTHLTFQFVHCYDECNCDITSTYTSSDDSNSNAGFSSNLVYLHMEAGHNFEHAFDSLISICPNLRALVVPNGYDAHGESLSKCDLLDARCSLLRYLLWDVETSDMCDHTETLNRWKVASASSDYDDQVGTLREVIYTTNGCFNETIVPLLLRSQQYLVHAEFQPRAYYAFSDSTPTQIIELANLRLSQVKHVVLKAPDEDEIEWIDFVNGCEQLESLEVYTTYDCPLLYMLVEAINTPESLQILTIQGFGDGSSKYSTSIGCILQRFSALQHLEISNIFLSDQDLVDIYGIQALQSLKVSMNYRYNDISLEGLVEATKNLQITDTKIRVMELIHMTNLTDEVLEDLGKIKSLSKISVEFNKHITDKGVQSFIHEPHSGRRSFTVHRCPKTSHEGKWIYIS